MQLENLGKLMKIQKYTMLFPKLHFQKQFILLSVNALWQGKLIYNKVHSHWDTIIHQIGIICQTVISNLEKA